MVFVRCYYYFGSLRDADMNITIYEGFVILFVCAATVFVTAYYIGKLKAELKHTRERLDRLEESASPLGYKQKAGIEEAQAYLLKALHAYEAANEYLNAVKRDGYNPDPGKW